MKSKEIHKPTITPDGSSNNLGLGVSNKDYKVCDQDYKQSISEKIFQVSAKARALQWDFITPDEKPNAQASKPEFMASVQDNAVANFIMTCDELDEPSTVPVRSLELPGPEVGNTNSNDSMPENIFSGKKKGVIRISYKKKLDYVNQVLPEKRNEYTYSSIQKGHISRDSTKKSLQNRSTDLCSDSQQTPSRESNLQENRQCTNCMDATITGE